MSINNPSREYLLALRLLREWYYRSWVPAQYITRVDVGFASTLYDCIAHADHHQKAKLAKAFPTEFAAFCAWERALDTDAFFEEIFGEKHENLPLETPNFSANTLPRDGEHATHEADQEQ